MSMHVRWLWIALAHSLFENAIITNLQCTLCLENSLQAKANHLNKHLNFAEEKKKKKTVSAVKIFHKTDEIVGRKLRNIILCTECWHLNYEKLTGKLKWGNKQIVRNVCARISREWNVSQNPYVKIEVKQISRKRYLKRRWWNIPLLV